MLPRSLLVFTALAGLVTSQIDPNSVDLPTRDTWCVNQKASCPLICLQVKGASGNPQENTCDPKTLVYACVCSNGITPNASEYTQTIPFYICTEQNNQCVDSCNGVLSCQASCRNDHPCGAQDPPRINATATTTSGVAETGTAAATATDVVYNGFGTATAASNPKKDMSPKALALDIGQVYGVFVVVGGFLAGFATLL